MSSTSAGSFFSVLTEAVAYFTLHGFTSEQALLDWMERIRAAARASLTPESVVERSVREALIGAYQRNVERGGILVRHGDIPRFTIDRVKPKLRAELDRRIMASANLIRLNRAQSIEKTVQRLAGWVTSIPAGGSDVVERVPVKQDIRKALAQLPFEDRRVAIDQSHKLVSSISSIIAVDGGAIAGVWHDHGAHDKTYDARPEHLKRTGKVYLIRDSWAQKAGLVKPGAAGYTDEITQPGQEVFCRCFYSYLYALRRLPDSMLTQKGRDTLAERKAA